MSTKNTNDSLYSIGTEEPGAIRYMDGDEFVRIDEEDNRSMITKRLTGGMAEKVNDMDDVLRVDVLDDTEEKSREVAPSGEPQPSKLDKFFTYAKHIVFSSVWIFCTFLIFTGKEEKPYKRTAAVPVNSTLDISLPFNYIKERVSAKFIGPFQVDDDVNTTNTEYSLHLQLYRISDGEVIYVSKEETIYLDNSSKFDIFEERYYQYNIGKEYTKSDTERVRMNFTQNLPYVLPMLIVFDRHPMDKTVGVYWGLAILIFLYVLIVWEIINRTLAAITAAILSISVLTLLETRPSLTTIMDWIDRETLMLLFGMMILVAILSESGIFDYLAVYAYEITKGRIWPLINTLCFFAASLSAFLDNVTMMLLVTPVTIRLCEVTKVNPLPVLICMVIFSNLGAASTPVGDPPNVIICMNPDVAKSNLTFNEFALHMIPGILLASVQCYIQLRWYYHRQGALGPNEQDKFAELKQEISVWEKTASGVFNLSKDERNLREKLLKRINALKRKLGGIAKNNTPISQEFEETLARLKAQYPIRSKKLLLKSTFAFVLVIILFVTHSLPDFHHLSLGWSAMIGALFLMVIADIDDVEAIILRIEWPTLLFFASLFIVMECLTEMGVIDVIGHYVTEAILYVSPEHRLGVALIMICWVSAIASAFLNNIPVSTMMIKIIIQLAKNKQLQLPLHPLVWALAFGVCFGGNGTMIGASANVVCAGIIEQHGYKFDFVDFIVVAFPVMIGSIIMASIYLYVAHVVYQWHD